MKRLPSHSIGIDQGEIFLFSDFKVDGPMWSGDGERDVVQTVTFSENFRSVPVVNVGISMWDVDVSTNLRADILAQNITVSGFDIVFKTWGDSKLARIRASWTAFGEVQQADDWTL